MSEETNNMLMEDMLKEIDRQRSEITRLTAELANVTAERDLAIKAIGPTERELAKAREARDCVNCTSNGMDCSRRNYSCAGFVKNEAAEGRKEMRDERTQP